MRDGGGAVSESKLEPIAEAREFDEAVKDFITLLKEAYSRVLLDIAEDGRLDTPDYRAKAKRLKNALKEALV